MSQSQQFLTIAIIALGTIITRFLPFILFPTGRAMPPYVRYLGKALPPAVFGLLVVYCLKGTTVLIGNHGLPELIAICFILGLHLYKRKMLLSIAGGTVCYMLLVQFIFAA